MSRTVESFSLVDHFGETIGDSDGELTAFSLRGLFDLIDVHLESDGGVTVFEAFSGDSLVSPEDCSVFGHRLSTCSIVQERTVVTDLKLDLVLLPGNHGA